MHGRELIEEPTDEQAAEFYAAARTARICLRARCGRSRSQQEDDDQNRAMLSLLDVVEEAERKDALKRRRVRGAGASTVHAAYAGAADSA